MKYFLSIFLLLVLPLDLLCSFLSFLCVWQLEKDKFFMVERAHCEYAQ